MVLGGSGSSISPSLGGERARVDAWVAPPEQAWESPGSAVAGLEVEPVQVPWPLDGGAGSAGGPCSLGKIVLFAFETSSLGPSGVWARLDVSAKTCGFSGSSVFSGRTKDTWIGSLFSSFGSRCNSSQGRSGRLRATTTSRCNITDNRRNQPVRDCGVYERGATRTINLTPGSVPTATCILGNVGGSPIGVK